MDPHREACRRHHRIVAHYLSHHAWLNRLDCIAIKRSEMEKLLGIERFKGERVKWMKEDFRPWFPHQDFLILSGSGGGLSRGTFSTAYLSRIDTEDEFPKGSMHDVERIARLKSAGISADYLFQRKRTPNIEEITIELALLGAGLKLPVAKKKVAKKKVAKKKVAKKKVAKKKVAKKKVAKKKR